ncbi:MAG: LexA family transcriptional regulator [Rhodospirillales bacterium]|nr:LexA family transcriptional regulator [Rhodospirillales bacterium]MCB9979578.1 LexA family transcriptional regulator [Rhodospirillales bacterium]
MDEKFRQRIEFLVSKVGGQSALARATNMSLGAIQRYLRGGEPTRQALIRLAKAGSVSMSWLIYGDEEKMAISAEGKPKIKLYGFGDSAKQEWQEPFQYRIKTELEWPDPEFFAVLVGDDLMAGEGIRNNFTCYVSPNTRPQPGDVVFVKNTKGTATLKKYIKEDMQWVYLQSRAATTSKNEETVLDEQLKQSDLEIVAPVVFVKRR